MDPRNELLELMQERPEYLDKTIPSQDDGAEKIFRARLNELDLGDKEQLKKFIGHFLR